MIWLLCLRYQEILIGLHSIAQASAFADFFLSLISSSSVPVI